MDFQDKTPFLQSALRFSPAHQKQWGSALFDFWSAVSNIPLKVSDPGVARLKLAWWIQELSKGTHPVTQALLALPDYFTHTRPILESIVSHLLTSIASPPPENFDAFLKEQTETFGALLSTFLPDKNASQTQISQIKEAGSWVQALFCLPRRLSSLENAPDLLLKEAQIIAKHCESLEKSLFETRDFHCMPVGILLRLSKILAHRIQPQSDKGLFAYTPLSSWTLFWESWKVAWRFR